MTQNELQKLTGVLEAAGFAVVAVDAGAFFAYCAAQVRRHAPTAEKHHRLPAS